MSWQYGIARDALTSSVMTRLANQMQVRLRSSDDSDQCRTPSGSRSGVRRRRRGPELTAADKFSGLINGLSGPSSYSQACADRADFCDGSKTPVGYL